MLSSAIDLFYTTLKDYVTPPDSGSQVELVCYPTTEANEVKIGDNCLTTMLVNVREENVLRNQQMYRRVSGSGSESTVLKRKGRDVRLELYVLVLAKNENYLESLRQLSASIECFQKNTVLVDEDKGLRLVVELMGMDFAIQNEVWNALRMSYIPSLVFKMGMVLMENLSEVELIELENVTVTTKIKG